jgi:hypothetical protein
MNRLLGLGFVILILFGCQQESKTGFVGQQFILKADIPNEAGTFDYIWKITDLPETSELMLSDIQFSEDESQAIFVPDVTGHFTIQVTVWKYNDKLGALVYNYDISETTPEVTAQQQSRDDWLNETVEGASLEKDIKSTVQNEQSETTELDDEVSSELSSTELTQGKTVTEEKPVTTVTQPVIITEANFTIQVAAEKKIDVTTQIVNRLIEAGYDAYYQEHTTASNQILYRIRIGKFATRDAALQVADKITSDQGLPTWITSYQK